MSDSQDLLEKIKAYGRQRLADKGFLMVAGAAFIMLIIFGFWLVSLHASFTAHPPVAGIAKDLQFDDFKKEFNTSLKKIEDQLKAEEAKQQAVANASTSLNQNLNNLMISIQKTQASSTPISPVVASSSSEQNIKALKANLLKIESRLQH